MFTKHQVDGEQLVIKHLYIERRMIPLTMYLQSAEPEQLARVVDDYGRAIKQLAAANIFPGDLLLNNFGVTRQGRVVFYDYDEICYLTECNFRRIPPAPYPELEMSDEPWYSVGPADVFPEEFATFLLADPSVRQAFLKSHRDLLAANYWQQRQERVNAGVLEDVFPYLEAKRFPRRLDVPAKRLYTEPEILAAACG